MKANSKALANSSNSTMQISSNMSGLCEIFIPNKVFTFLACISYHMVLYHVILYIISVWPVFSIMIQLLIELIELKY